MQNLAGRLLYNILQKALSSNRGCTVGHTETGGPAPQNASGQGTSITVPAMDSGKPLG
jgi:hypothetical protein